MRDRDHVPRGRLCRSTISKWRKSPRTRLPQEALPLRPSRSCVPTGISNWFSQGSEERDVPNAKETEILRPLVHRRDLRDDEHPAAEDTRCTGARERPTEDEDVHVRRGATDHTADLEEDDGEADDVFRGEDLGELGVKEVEAEEGEEEAVGEPWQLCRIERDSSSPRIPSDMCQMRRGVEACQRGSKDSPGISC